MGNLIDKYRALPEANKVPDEVWAVQKLLDEIAALDARKAELLEQLTWTETPKMMALLKRDWTDAELKKAGLMAS